MDIKIILISIVLLALAFAGLMIKILSRQGSEFPRSSCGGYRSDANEGSEKCAVCDLKNTDKCPSDILFEKK
ncbi:MAG: membrane or secreted protein [Mariniphaga sp.]|nr:membrane or secreted protein [Mariniphaga sp.]